MPFAGFTNDTLKFLKDIRKNNDKAWFDEHKADYEEHWLEAGKAFITAAGPKLKKIAPGVSFEPKINGSLFRIYRDVRFSQDKRPYKDHLDVWFWEGKKRKGAVSGFFFRLKADEIGFGVGAHMFDKPKLAAYRDLVVDADAGKSLLSAVKKVEKAGYDVKGEHYKKLPRGYDAEGEAARLLKHNALFAGYEQTGAKKVAELAKDNKLIDTCMGHWKKMLPLHRWLVDKLD